MVEPNMATMLVFFLTDVALPGGRDDLTLALSNAVNASFNRISIDADTSTSDTVVCMSSDLKQCDNVQAFSSALTGLSVALSDDVVRNGEGVSHVMRVSVKGAPTERIAVGVGKSIVNSPLFKSAVCGNDPNVGRLASAIGKFFGWMSCEDGPHGSWRVSLTQINVEFRLVGCPFSLRAHLRLTRKARTKFRHMLAAQLYTSKPLINKNSGHITFPASVSWPRHKRYVDIHVDLGMPCQSLENKVIEVLGASLTHEYVSENADYRS